MPSGENIFVIVDYYSCFFQTVFLKTVTVVKTVIVVRLIEALVPNFAWWCSPLTLRTDNGAQFVSTVFQNFLHEHGVEHRSIPYWPQANDEVERQNCSI